MNEARWFLGAAIVGAATLALVGAAHGDDGRHCTTLDAAKSMLAQQYDEVPVARRLTKDGAAVVTFANLRTGTWTDVEAIPGGKVCPLASGTGYEPSGTLVLPGGAVS